MPQFAGAFGQCREHGVTVGNGFVARQVQSAGQVLGALNGFFFHDEILTRGVTPLRIYTTSPWFPFFNFTFPCAELSVRPVFARRALYHAVKSRGFAMR